MHGWIINLWDDKLPAPHTRMEMRQQNPLFFTSQAEPVFEVWFWHDRTGRWYVLTGDLNAPQVSGAVYFSSTESLRQKLQALSA